MSITRLIAIVMVMSAIAAFGCSSTSNPVNSDGITGTVVSDAFQPQSSVGIMGAYEVNISSDHSVEITSKRINAIGESWIVSGTAFFTAAPCADCLKLDGLKMVDGDLALTFEVSHPFDKGNPANPPTAVNRLDLDVFDLAAVIHPQGVDPTIWDLGLEALLADVVLNADGYNLDLFEVLTEFSNLPYIIINDETEMDPIPSPTTWNKFEMGSSALFDVVFNLEPGETLNFDLYLTMGYGASARKLDRLTPKYYNPEFNRKSAWKVVVTPPEGEDPPALGNTWDSTDSTTEYTVKVEVYDWQIGAAVTTETDMELADPSEIWEASGVDQVRIEIPGMTADYAVSTTDDGTGTGMPGSPLVFNIPIANENLNLAGEYLGLVCVEDERTIGDPSFDDNDFLIHTDDGIVLQNFIIPSFWTYQTFTATVVEGL